MIPVIIEASKKKLLERRLFMFLFPATGKRQKAEKGEIELVNNETPILKIKTSENVQIIQIKEE
jgi:hypothetical protein